MSNNQNHQIIIIEDELVIAENTKMMINVLYPSFQVEIAGSSKEAEQILQQFNATLALLDIRLGTNDNGIEFSKVLDKKGIPFIFLTAHGDPKTISNAIQTDPLGYLIKPISRHDLYANLELVFSKLENQKYYSFRDGTHDIRLPEKEIIYLQVDGNYTEIHTVKKRYVVRKSMKKVLDDIHLKLYQVHRNYFVNPAFIKEANASVYLSNGEILPLSRNYKKELIENIFS